MLRWYPGSNSSLLPVGVIIIISGLNFLGLSVYAKYLRRPKSALNSILEQYTRLFESNEVFQKSLTVWIFDTGDDIYLDIV